MYLTIRQQLMIWSFASQIIDSRFSLIALTARLVMAFALRAMVCTYTDFLCTFVLLFEVDHICARLNFKMYVKYLAHRVEPQLSRRIQYRFLNTYGRLNSKPLVLDMRNKFVQRQFTKLEHRFP